MEECNRLSFAQFHSVSESMIALSLISLGLCHIFQTTTVSTKKGEDIHTTEVNKKTKENKQRKTKPKWEHHRKAVILTPKPEICI